MRLSFLDSIRGAAALIVVTAHLHFAARPETWFLSLNGLRIFNQSVFAVAIFFVLSGLVLFLQIERERVNYFRFVVRRAFRIFPACIFAVTASYVIYLLWSPAPVVSRGEWFNEVTWPPGITFDSYVGHLSLSGPDALLRTLWSLVIEWRVSLIFPAIVMLFMWSPWLAGLISAGAALAIAASPVSLITAGAYGIPGWYFYVAFFSTFFVAGTLIAAYRLHLVLFFRKWPLARYALLAVSIYYLCFRSASDDRYGYMTLGLVGCALIIFCMSDSRARRLLRLRPFRYLGKISYSLYLVHIIWIGILFRALDGTNALVISVAVIAASILSADLTYRWIEAPANRLGRRISAQIKWPSRGAQADTTA